MATLQITRGSSPALEVTIREAGGGDPMNLTGVPLDIIDDDLPFTLDIEATDAVNGKAQITFPDTSDMELGRSYGMRILVGAVGDPGTFATRKIEVVAA